MKPMNSNKNKLNGSKKISQVKKKKKNAIFNQCQTQPKEKKKKKKVIPKQA